MQTLTALSVFLAISSALLLYGLNYDTRVLEVGVLTSERRAERLRSEIAILRAERTYLARPDRIGPLARKLGLRPTESGQIELRVPEQATAGTGVTPLPAERRETELDRKIEALAAASAPSGE